MAVMVAERMLTRADLDALPDDGLRHELIDGAIVMTPAPGFGHQSVVGCLFALLREATIGTDLYVVLAPFDVLMAEAVVEPDLVVARRTDFRERDLPVAPLLVVEVRSRSTAWIDNGRKRELYEQAGIPSYWLVDPKAPSITVLELQGGSYVQRAYAQGDHIVELTQPFPIELNPAALARG